MTVGSPVERSAFVILTGMGFSGTMSGVFARSMARESAIIVVSESKVREITNSVGRRWFWPSDADFQDIDKTRRLVWEFLYIARDFALLKSKKRTELECFPTMPIQKVPSRFEDLIASMHANAVGASSTTECASSESVRATSSSTTHLPKIAEELFSHHSNNSVSIGTDSGRSETTFKALMSDRFNTQRPVRSLKTKKLPVHSNDP